MLDAAEHRHMRAYTIRGKLNIRNRMAAKPLLLGGWNRLCACSTIGLLLSL